MSVFIVMQQGELPARDWLESLPAAAKEAGLMRLELLAAFGNNLRRPHADYLRDGIYELRWHVLRVQYRLLYFFSGRQVVIVSHGLTKEERVPDREIETAIRRKKELKI